MSGLNRAAVPFVDLEPIHAPLRMDFMAAFERILGSGDFVAGSAIERFEASFAAYTGSEHCVSTASGTAALTLALLASGIESGGEVIVPAHTFVASALAVVHAGMHPVVCDVDPVTGLIDLDDATARITARTQALMPVHLYGQMCDPVPISGFAAKHGLAIIEDAAQAHGASRNGIKAGGAGTASAFSFYPSKNLGAHGDGGAICTNDSDLARRAAELRDLGRRAKADHVRAGYNERLDTIQAAVLGIKLPHLDDWNSARIAAARIYDERLPIEVGRLPASSGAACVYHVYPIRLANRDEVREVLAASGVQTGIHYPVPLHGQPALADRLAGAELPVAECWAAEELSLPIFAGISEGQVERVCTALARAIATI